MDFVLAFVEFLVLFLIQPLVDAIVGGAQGLVGGGEESVV